MDDWESIADADVSTLEKKLGVVEVDQPVSLEKDETAEGTKSQPANPDKLAKKAKAQELNKKFEDKKVYDDPFINKGPLTADERRKMEQLSMALDQRNTLELFGDLANKQTELTKGDEEAYLNYAKQITEILLKEDRKLYIQEFVKELLQGLYGKLTSKEFQEIYNKSLVLFNNKQKDEKPVVGKKKKETKPVLNMAKANVGSKNVKYQGGGDDDEEEEEDEEYVGGKYKNDDFM
jgi:hypothetical protein